MAEIYDIQSIMNALKEKEEMDPDKHDGCYYLMSLSGPQYRVS